MAAAMTWSDPVRGVALMRTRAFALMARGAAVYCVWSGRRLAPDTLDVDRCLLWSAWPCGELWNRMPAHRRVDQYSKRERMPSDYLRPDDQVLRVRFAPEARASLPGLVGANLVSGPQVQVALQRTQLGQDQGIPELVWRP